MSKSWECFDKIIDTLEIALEKLKVEI